MVTETFFITCFLELYGHFCSPIHLPLSDFYKVFLTSNMAEDDGFLMVIKIHSMTFFGGELMPSV
jgi:hypothetical protein